MPVSKQVVSKYTGIKAACLNDTVLARTEAFATQLQVVNTKCKDSQFCSSAMYNSPSIFRVHIEYGEDLSKFLGCNYSRIARKDSTLDV